MNQLFKHVVCVSLCVFACFGSLEAKQQAYGNLYVTNVDRVYDGDTFMVDIADVHPVIGKDISIRIDGIDAPEMTDPSSKVRELAHKARDYVVQRLQNAQVIELRNIKRDKYFRLLAKVYVDNANLGEELIQEGLAKPYDGKTKPRW